MNPRCDAEKLQIVLTRIGSAAGQLRCGHVGQQSGPSADTCGACVVVVQDPDFITECNNMCNSFCWFLSESEQFQVCLRTAFLISEARHSKEEGSHGPIIIIITTTTTLHL
eukprot:1234887-Rhodomonas_salina.3